jgi:hypothetical protein
LFGRAAREDGNANGERTELAWLYGRAGSGEGLIRGSSSRGSQVQGLSSSCDYTLYDKLNQKIPDAIQQLREVVDELQQAGITIEVKYKEEMMAIPSL